MRSFNGIVHMYSEWEWSETGKRGTRTPPFQTTNIDCSIVEEEKEKRPIGAYW